MAWSSLSWLSGTDTGIRTSQLCDGRCGDVDRTSARICTLNVPMPKTPVSPHSSSRAWMRLPSGRHLDLMNPSPDDWTDEDLAVRLARTFRWGGESRWP